MDISKEYIEKCGKAEEVQEGWNIQIGDAVGTISSNHGVEFCGFTCTEGGFFVFKQVIKQCVRFQGGGSHEIVKKNYIWLPRQDQLQKIVGERCKGVSVLVEYLKRYCNSDTKTMEQLWLEIVMSEFHNKQWNGKDWKELGHE